MVFFDLEWNQLDDDKAQVIMDDPKLEKFRYHMEADRRYKPYNLSEARRTNLDRKECHQRWCMDAFLHPVDQFVYL